MSGVRDQVSDLGAEIFADDSTHVMNQIHHVFLRRHNHLKK